MLSRTTTNRPQTVDLRTVDALNVEDTGLHLKDYAVLAVLAVNDREPITQITHFQKFVYIAQVGGLHDTDRDSGTYNALPVYFPFRNKTYGPFSDELSARLDELEDHGLISTTEYPPQSKLGNGRTEYAITDDGYALLNTQPLPFPVEQIRTIKYVTKLYRDEPLPELVARTKSDFEFRELNDQWA